MKLFSESSKLSDDGKVKLKRAVTTNAISRKKIKLKRADNSEQVNQTSAGAQLEQKKQPLKLSKNGIKLKRTSLTRTKTRSNKETKQNIYGLDVDFLKELGKNNLVEVRCPLRGIGLRRAPEAEPRKQIRSQM